MIKKYQHISELMELKTDSAYESMGTFHGFFTPQKWLTKAAQTAAVSLKPGLEVDAWIAKNPMPWLNPGRQNMVKPG